MSQMRVGFSFLVGGALVLSASAGTFAQEKKTDSPGTSASQPAKAKDAASGNNNTTKPAAKPANPRQIRVHLMDGSIIAGEMTVSQIEVKTEFGTLTVPVEKIISITPGLQSHTKLAEKINKLIKELGGPDYKAREEAQKELLSMGPAVRDIVADHTDSKNAELKRRATEIVAKLDEASGDSGDDGFEDEDSKPRKWVKFDIVKTAKFSIAGKISPSEFKIASKYGPLNVSLNDIQRTERQYMAKEAVVARLTVKGQKLVQRGLQSSKIRVNAGDTISVTATGTVIMSPWGSSSRVGPDGASNYGTWYGPSQGGRNTSFYGGCLLARIGSSGGYIKIGSRARFVAKKSGVLQFGLAMNNSYTSSSYYYPGEYKLRIKVDPKK